MTAPCIWITLHLIRHVHIIYLSQNTKTRWAGPQPVKPVFVTLTYGSRTANRTDSLYQTVGGLVGNADWGESLTVAACEFPGLNSSICMYSGFHHLVTCIHYSPNYIHSSTNIDQGSLVPHGAIYALYMVPPALFMVPSSLFMVTFFMVPPLK